MLVGKRYGADSKCLESACPRVSTSLCFLGPALSILCYLGPGLVGRYTRYYQNREAGAHLDTIEFVELGIYKIVM